MENEYLWYTNGLSLDEARNLEHDYAKIEMAEFGLDNHSQLCLTIGIQYASRDNSACLMMNNFDDIRIFLQKAKSGSDVKNLVGKVIVAVRKDDALRAITVNERLI